MPQTEALSICKFIALSTSSIPPAAIALAWFSAVHFICCVCSIVGYKFLRFLIVNAPSAPSPSPHASTVVICAFNTLIVTSTPPISPALF